MRQLVCNATTKVEVVERSAPQVGVGELLVTLNACGICGTDVMKVYDAGVSKPAQIGHEIVGTVLEAGGGFVKGQRVAVAHHAPDYGSHFSRRGSETQDPVFKSSNVDPGGFAEIIRVPADLVPHTVHVIPDKMPELRAVFMEPLACCLRALDRAPVSAGDTVLVVGVGAIGLLFVPLLRDRGVSIVATDVREDRLLLAEQWGATAVPGFGKDDIVQETMQRCSGRGADLVILTVVNQSTLELALAAVRDGGVIVPFGVKPDTLLQFDLWQTYRREISVVASYSATPDGLKRAMVLLARDGFAFETLVSHVISLREGQRGFDLLHDALASKVVIVPDTSV